MDDQDPDEQRRRRDEYVELFEIGDLLAKPVRQLSLGERMRCEIVASLLHAPEILFLDEPTASLDPSVTRTIEDLINDIFAAGTKIVMTTHDLGQARRMADEVIFLHRGRVLEHAPAEAFFQAPESEAAQAFLAGELFW